MAGKRFRKRLGGWAGPVLLLAAVLAWLLVPPLRSPLRTLAVFAFPLTWLTTELTTRARERRAAPRPPPARPVLSIDAHGRGDWLYQPSATSTEVELRLRHRRYVAVFPRAETDLYRATIAEITKALNDGTRMVDVNAAFAAKLHREPFEDRGPIPRTRLDRLLNLNTP